MTSVCFKRLQKELISIKKNPVDHISTTPNEDNLLEWHYVIEGPPGSVYEGGFYHGVLRFPKEYPYKPPSILMFTRNGRFRQNVRLCLSMSDYHPESWNPMWSVASILSGLMSFMLDSQSTLGSMEATDEVRRQYAKESLRENMKNPVFRKLFPQYVKLAEERSKAGNSRERNGSAENQQDGGDDNSPNDNGEDVQGAEEQAGNGVAENPVRNRRQWRRLAGVLSTALVAAIAVFYGLFISKYDRDGVAK